MYCETEGDLNPERVVLVMVWGGLVVIWVGLGCLHGPTNQTPRQLCPLE